METREKLRISASSIGCLSDCELKFKYAYLDKLRPKLGGNIYSVFGSAIHSTIEDFYLGARFDDPSLITAKWPELFAEEVSSKGLVVTPENMDKFREIGFDILDLFYLRQKEDGHLLIPKHTEKKMVVENDRYVVVGILDIAYDVEGGFEIIDFKTSAKAKTKKEIAVDVQLTCYAWLYFKTFGVLPKRLGLHYLKLNKIVYATRTMEDLELFSKRLDVLYESVTTKSDWKPNPGHCHWCDYREQCSYNESQKVRLV